MVWQPELCRYRIPLKAFTLPRGEFVTGAKRQARIVHPLYTRMLREEGGNLERIF